jgi:hypothetical protein
MRSDDDPDAFGDGHHRYRAPWLRRKTLALVAAIKHLIQNPNENKVAWIARDFNVPDSTVRLWRDKLKRCPDWSPFETAWGEHRRIFTDDIEEKKGDRDSGAVHQSPPLIHNGGFSQFRSEVVSGRVL